MIFVRIPQASLFGIGVADFRGHLLCYRVVIISGQGETAGATKASYASGLHVQCLKSQNFAGISLPTWLAVTPHGQPDDVMVRNIAPFVGSHSL